MLSSRLPLAFCFTHGIVYMSALLFQFIPPSSPTVSTSVLCICISAAAAKSLQSCLTLCDPMDCSPPGSSIHGIFQARVLEWGAIAFFDLHLYYLLFRQSVNIFFEYPSIVVFFKRRGSTFHNISCLDIFFFHFTLVLETIVYRYT